MIPRQYLLWLSTLCLFTSFAVGQENTTYPQDVSTPTTPGPDARNGKVFSLFSVVTFKNTGCKSQSTMSSGQSTVRNGTCFTSSECSSKGGTASGNCASGFGVCCLFLVSTSGSTINQNCTYIRNPSFPSAYSATSALSFTISKCSSDVCYLRLDFETFNILGPTSTADLAATVAATTAGSECPDQFKVTTNTGTTSGTSFGQSIPIICGTNTGQHIYIDIGNQATDTATLSFTFSTATSTVRNWEIKVSQITCSNPNRPPNGCLQYHTTLTGRITTFNFFSTSTTSRHLDNQNYSACIRKGQGYCCIQYVQCDGVPNSFSLDGTIIATTFGVVDTACTNDYITIPGSSSTGCSATNGKLNGKYCGQYLGINFATAAINPISPVCDCTGSFQVGIHTDNTGDIATPAAINTAASNRGDCLDFQQVPCTN